MSSRPFFFLTPRSVTVFDAVIIAAKTPGAKSAEASRGNEKDDRAKHARDGGHEVRQCHAAAQKPERGAQIREQRAFIGIVRPLGRQIVALAHIFCH